MIETGTWRGGGTLLWASLLNMVNPADKVFTVDIKNWEGKVVDDPLFKEKAIQLFGSSTDKEIIDKIRDIVSVATAVVILDSDHAKKHVLKEIELYKEFVPKNSYLIVTDTHYNGNPIKPLSERANRLF